MAFESFNTYDFWDRQYELRLGPYKIGGEKPVPIRCSFSISMSEESAQNNGRVTVWNLSKDKRDYLETTENTMELKAGYGTNLVPLFKGDITFCSSEREGGNWKTEIEVDDCTTEVKLTYVELAYEGVVSWETIMRDVAGKLNLPILFAPGLQFRKVYNGYSFVGQAVDVLDDACDSCELIWSIQNGVIEVKKEGGSIRNLVYDLTPKTGLLDTPKRVIITKAGNYKLNRIGYDIRYLMNGAIRVGDTIHLKSSTAEGYFVVYSVSFSGDSARGDWVCQARVEEEEKYNKTPASDVSSHIQAALNGIATHTPLNRPVRDSR